MRQQFHQSLQIGVILQGIVLSFQHRFISWRKMLPRQILYMRNVFGEHFLWVQEPSNKKQTVPYSHYQEHQCSTSQPPDVIICQETCIQTKTQASLTGLKPLLNSYHCLLICSAAANAKQFYPLPLYSKRKVGNNNFELCEVTTEATNHDYLIFIGCQLFPHCIKALLKCIQKRVQYPFRPVEHLFLLYSPIVSHVSVRSVGVVGEPVRKGQHPVWTQLGQW